MAEFVLSERRGAVGFITLNRPEVLNAWNAAMRDQLTATLSAMEEDPEVRAVILTGAGDRAFGAGQDLNETKTFDAERAEQWIGEWERLYDRIRSLSKPIIAALNGVAAGSAFQVALLCDLRVGHPGVTMGQPEINSGIASTTGPWIMREIIGLAHTIDLTLTGRMMEAEECYRVGVLSRLVPKDKVMSEALALAELLASKPPVAMRLDRQRFREMTEEGFRDCLAAGIRIQREAYASGEPSRMMEQFLARKAAAKKG
jgi:enoyl-CoA hydratase/carnithine racemase